MKVDGKDIRPIWLNQEDDAIVNVIDQRMLPHEFIVADLTTVDQTIEAIREMFVRGAPLIGATGAYGVYLAALTLGEKCADDALLTAECDRLKAARPTAVNLEWAVDRVLGILKKAASADERIDLARTEAAVICDEEAENCRLIGEHGLSLVEEIAKKKNGETVNILTHCNAG